MKRRPRIKALRLLALALGILAPPGSAMVVLAEEACPRTGCLRCCPGQPPPVGIICAPSNTRHYGGYYVGGGTIFPGGKPRYANEGTWGWDYGGLLNRKWVVLDWSHGRRYQAGGGTYRTAGPAPHASQ